MIDIQMVEQDICRIQRVLDGDTSISKIRLLKEMEGKYSVCIQDFYKGLWNASAEYGLFLNESDEYTTSTIDNLYFVKAKLIGYKNGLNVRVPDNGSSTTVTVNNNIDVSLSFKDVYKKIEDMPSLSASETVEILDKLKQLEEIVKSNDSRKSKWSKISPFLKWLADKSVDVGMVLLPLILGL